MNKCHSSTEYLDEILLNSSGLITRDAMETVKGYCGLFAFVLSICNRDDITDAKKSSLIKSILTSSLIFMEKKYEANLELYRRHATDNLENGKLFKSLSEIPAQMQEDYEMGLADAEKFLLVEIRDILRIIDADLEI